MSSMSTERDFYAILGVSRNADTRTISKAYKKLALKYHPDRNGGDEAAKEKFHEILTAHEILKDSQKRNIYDKYGERGLRANGKFPTNIEDLFDLVFAENINNNDNDADNAAQTALAKVKVNVTLSDIYYGATKTISCNFSKSCMLCNGKGSIINEQSVQCQNCHGMGYYYNWKNAKKECNKCQDGKYYIQNKAKCYQCHGRGTFTANITGQKVSIPPGSRNGATIRVPYKNYGDGFFGDILVEISYKRDPRYRIKGNDLIMIEPVPIDLRDALCGGNFTVQHFNETLLVECKCGVIQSTEMYKIAGKGLLILNGYQGQNSGRRGDLYVKCQIIMPASKSLDPYVIQQLSRLLPSSQHSQGVNGQNRSSKVKLEPLNEWDNLGFSGNDNQSTENKSNTDSNEEAPECKQM